MASAAEASRDHGDVDPVRMRAKRPLPARRRPLRQLADVGKVFVEVYESTPFPKLRLLARALEHATELAGGRVVVSELRREDFEAAGADEPYSEGVIDHLRAVDGAELVALVRELPEGAPARRKGSLRSHPDGVDS